MPVVGLGLQLRHRLSNVAEAERHVRRQALARLRQPDPAPVAVEQAQAQLVLQVFGHAG